MLIKMILLNYVIFFLNRDFIGDGWKIDVNRLIRFRVGVCKSLLIFLL